jgi:hypothetical protein
MFCSCCASLPSKIIVFYRLNEPLVGLITWPGVSGLCVGATLQVYRVRMPCHLFCVGPVICGNYSDG